MTPPINPPTDNLYRVLRGGGWHYDDAAGVRAADRVADAPAIGSSDLGFRCAQRGAKMPVGKGTP